MSIAYICIGSNIGDRVGYIQQAHSLLNDAESIKVVQSSSLYETEPFGFKDQEWFINAVLEVETTLTPKDLLDKCIKIENQLGRIKHPEEPKWGPRNIDLDILFYDDQIISTVDLQIPHPHVHERAFVLVPLLEIAPDFVHPVIGKGIMELHNSLPNPEEVCLYGTRNI